MRAWPVVLLAGVLPACGGSSPSVPSLPQSVRVSVVSGDTGRAVAGAVISAAGGSVTTDAGGAGSLQLAAGTPITIEAAAFLLRETAWRDDPVFPLWPLRADADQDFLNELVYNRLIAGGALTRPVAGVYFTLSEELRGDAGLSAVQERAAGLVSGANGGGIPFIVSDNPPPGAVVFGVSVNGADVFFQQNPGFGAVTRVMSLRNRIASGSTTFRSIRDASLFQLATHEMGHAFGLGHPSQPGLMSPATIGSYQDFSAAEKSAMRMMLLRLPGNLPPDNDRSASASAARRTAVVGCGLDL